jgi:hypothetical protein
VTHNAAISPERRLAELAPSESRWRFKYGDGRVLVSTGIYANWRDPREWTEGVRIVPVIGLRAEENPSDWGTVSEEELEAYERLD